MPLNATQHERLQDHVETTKLVLVQLAALVLSRVLNVLREPLVKLVMRVEQARHDEMKERPEFYKIVDEKAGGKRCIYTTYLAWSFESVYL